MTNFIYNMQDELFDLNMILPVGKFSPIKKLVDHIEAQGKQLRELNAAITKRNATIGKYEREKKELQTNNSYLIKKVNELNQGIRNYEDLTWKQKYYALLHSSEQAIGALQKKCQEYKNADTIDALIKENKELKEEVNLYIGVCNTKHEEVKALAKAVRCPWGNNAEIISAKTARIKKLKEDLEKEKQVSKDLNVIINSKNKLLDEYMTKCNNLEHNYNEEVRMKEPFKSTCFEHERTIESQNSTIKKLKDYISELENEVAGLKKELYFWKTDDKRSFFGESFDMHSIYDLNRLEEVIADKIKSYDSRLYSIMAERDKYKESSEEYRLKLMVAERQRDEHIKADKTLSKIHDLIHEKE